jgi:hypothetical protein
MLSLGLTGARLHAWKGFTSYVSGVHACGRSLMINESFCILGEKFQLAG